MEKSDIQKMKAVIEWDKSLKKIYSDFVEIGSLLSSGVIPAEIQNEWRGLLSDIKTLRNDTQRIIAYLKITE